MSNELDDMEDMVEVSNEKLNTKYQPTDAEWTKYVLELLDAEEYVDGHPSVAGLRRVTEAIFGKILESITEVISAPDKDYKNCTVVHNLTVLKHTGEAIKVNAAIDVTTQNTKAPFNKFLVSTADSRAEAKALRRLLKLNIVTAEELGDTNKTGDETTPIGFVQITAISKLCEKNNLNVLKVIGKFGKFKKIEEISKNIALDILKSLSDYQNDPTIYDDKFKGFNKNWRNK